MSQEESESAIRHSDEDIANVSELLDWLRDKYSIETWHIPENGPLSRENSITIPVQDVPVINDDLPDGWVVDGACGWGDAPAQMRIARIEEAGGT